MTPTLLLLTLLAGDGPNAFPHAGLSPTKAAAAMTVPEGFEVKLFAGEPDVKQPIAFCLDDRGRLWVAEAYTYPKRAPEGQGKDRILIFEDTDGDGHFDKRTVFMEGLNLVSGIEYGFGGVWVGAAPYLMFIPIDASGDKPAGPPKILLDGWAYEDTHETLNTFTWGPDGWLYGCHGVFTHSNVGKPGTLKEKRERINAGVWRYHPTKHVFEVFAHGTSNPWGLDFDEHGQMFVEACVIPHVFHIIQGGRYERQAGSHFNPHTYIDIKTIADHLHYASATPHAGNDRSDAAGGGHAHCGLLCYQGGLWPEEYRGKLFMGNIHGRRLNMDILKPKGSGYVASHGPDFLKANDAWARFINMRTAPDGNVYLLDWYDQQACHHPDEKIWDRSNGRIYKVCYRGGQPERGLDLASFTNAELIDLQLQAHQWSVRHSRRLLQERAAAGSMKCADKFRMMKLVKESDEGQLLRALWAIHATEPGGLTPAEHKDGARSRFPSVRAWLVQLALENRHPESWFVSELVRQARDDPSEVVRLSIAAGLQRLPLGQRWDILAGLLTQTKDAADHNLPCMYWYAAEPLAAVDAARALKLTRDGKLPLLYSLMARRVSSIGTPEAIGVVVQALAEAKDDGERALLLGGLQQGLKGRRQVPVPAGWADVVAKLPSSNGEIRSLLQALGVTFGDAAALRSLRAALADETAGAKRRREALESLLEARDAELPPTLQTLLKDAELRGPAIRGLAAFADAKTPDALLAVYASLGPAEKRDVLNTLVSRPAYALSLLDAVADKRIPTTDVPAEVLRNLRNLKDAAVAKRLAELYGVVRDTPADRKRLIAEWREIAIPPTPRPDPTFGRAVYAKVCQQCHKLYGVGSDIGPDITGANRSDFGYLLETILDPSAVIPKEYAATQIALKNGRVVIGIVKQETPTALTVTTANETLTIPVSDIESRTPSEVSMMPDDLFKNLSHTEVRALIDYLRGQSQVPLMATADNAKDFFNGKDLTFWDGDPKLWSVENGEIVGRSPGIAKNEFLKSHYIAGDFKLSLKVKLTPNKENSGIQFRSEVLPGGDVKGPQADIGQGWWGKLYEEHGRGLLWPRPGDPHVKPDQWNDYVMEAVGSRVKTWINGQPCVDLDDAKLARRGIIALQIHSGGPMEVRFKDLRLEVLAGK
jgi:putative membrane-bound dehydrogenase-like protein